MKIKYKTLTMKAKNVVSVFCFLFPLLGLGSFASFAQNTGYYKYIVNPDLSFNTDVLFIDNHYYVLSNGDDLAWFFLEGYGYPYCLSYPLTTVTVFDEGFNKIKQIQLLDNTFNGIKLFYEKNHFYVFGYQYNNSILNIFFAKIHFYF